MTVVVRYAPVLRRLHWLMAVLVALGYLLIEQRGIFPRGSGGRAAMFQGHYWVGITIFVLAVWRLLARRRHGAPAVTPALPRVQGFIAALMHVALYAFFIVMPLLGLATAWTDGKQVFIPFTQVALPALLAENEALAHTLEDLHGDIGEIFYWVIGFHIAAALYHHFVRKDDTLKRMR
jgi:superoxide oxidase